MLAFLLMTTRFCVRGNVKIMAVQSSIFLESKPRGERHHTSTLDPIDSEDDREFVHLIVSIYDRD